MSAFPLCRFFHYLFLKQNVSLDRFFFGPYFVSYRQNCHNKQREPFYILFYHFEKISLFTYLEIATFISGFCLFVYRTISPLNKTV